MGSNRRLQFMVVLSCIVLSVGGAYLLWPLPVTTLPERSNVHRMEAFVGNSWRDLPATARFEVPEGHISRIMATLTGFTRNPQAEERSNPGLGELWLHCDDGKMVQVSLYHSYGGACIYSVGRKCYSGGSDNKVDDAIRAAYADAVKD